MSGTKDKARARATIMQLNILLDLVGLSTYVMEQSKFGKRAHPRGDAWGYTRDYMAVYAPDSDQDEVIRLFGEVGARDDHSATRWLLKHDELVP